MEVWLAIIGIILGIAWLIYYYINEEMKDQERKEKQLKKIICETIEEVNTKEANKTLVVKYLLPTVILTETALNVIKNCTQFLTDEKMQSEYKQIAGDLNILIEQYNNE